MRRLWAALLLLYPRQYREMFAPEMLAILERRARPAWIEIAGLLKGAAVEWRRPRSSPANQAAPVNEIPAAEARVHTLLERMLYAIAHHQFETARTCCREEREAREQLRVMREKYGLRS